MEHGSNLPVEIWYAGNELSLENQKRLARFGNVYFRDAVEVFGGVPQDYWGYHIKGWMLKGSRFDEVMIADADVYFAQNPEKLFWHIGYRDTGALFFRDFRMKEFGPNPDHEKETEKGCTKWKHGYLDSYLLRRRYFRQWIPQPSCYLPKDMLFFWGDTKPTEEEKFLIHYQEAGVVLIDKKRHRKGVEKIHALNVNHKETYKIVYGDKETYWIGMEMAQEPYAFNHGFPVNIRGKWKVYGIKRHKIRLVHLIDGELFWFQKKPVPLGGAPIYKTYEGEKLRFLSQEEKQRLDHIGFYVNMFGGITRE